VIICLEIFAFVLGFTLIICRAAIFSDNSWFVRDLFDLAPEITETKVSSICIGPKNIYVGGIPAETVKEKNIAGAYRNRVIGVNFFNFFATSLANAKKHPAPYRRYRLYP